MVFKLFNNFTVSYHDIWIFCWPHRHCKYYSLLSNCRSYQTPFDEGISFAASYRFSLSTRSLSRIQMLIAQFCRTVLFHHALISFFVWVISRRQCSSQAEEISPSENSSVVPADIKVHIFISSLDGDFPLCCHPICFMIFVTQQTSIRLRFRLSSVLAFSRRFHRKQLQVNSAHSSPPIPQLHFC